MTKQSLTTPIRRLEGISYWVIEDPEGIYDFINTEIWKEWEADARSEGPHQDLWLKMLSKRKWSLKIADVDRIKLNPEIMNYVDSKSGYNFAESLAKRCEDLQCEIETFGVVIWPLVVRKEELVLVDGYRRYTTLRAMNVGRTYVYLGAL